MTNPIQLVIDAALEYGWTPLTRAEATAIVEDLIVNKGKTIPEDLTAVYELIKEYL